MIILNGRDEIREYRRTVNYLYKDTLMCEFYPLTLLRIQAETRNLDTQAERTAAIRIMRKEETGIVFVTTEALIQKMPALNNYVNEKTEVSVGDELEQVDLISKLINYGYERTEQVDAIGQFCLRGDILDIFPINELYPIRIEWFDKTVDAIRSFNLDTQRSIKTFDQIKILSIIINDNSDCLDSVFDYIDKYINVVFD